MTGEEIERLYPEFDEWWRKEKSYQTLNGVYLIKFWYEFLTRRKQRTESYGHERSMLLL
ncbi:unnamed protein product [marine sediment metagenome]|uniref:Uncharacterized protein n=1 Tax=marine sediment metagenome TaxID=412755 RepID=X1PVH7_9ZZZZ